MKRRLSEKGSTAFQNGQILSKRTDYANDQASTRVKKIKIKNKGGRFALKFTSILEYSFNKWLIA